MMGGFIKKAANSDEEMISENVSVNNKKTQEYTLVNSTCADSWLSLWLMSCGADSLRRLHTIALMVRSEKKGKSSLIKKKKTLSGFFAALRSQTHTPPKTPYILLCKSELILWERALEGFYKHLLKATH